jgi:hypothetical protein
MNDKRIVDFEGTIHDATTIHRAQRESKMRINSVEQLTGGIMNTTLSSLILLLVAITFLFIGGADCSSSPPPAEPAPVRVLLLGVNEAKESETKIRVLFENVSPKPIRILREFEPSFVFFSFLVTKADGTPVNQVTGGKVTFARDLNYVTLEPGELFGMSFPLTDILDKLDTPDKLEDGEYVLKVTYHNQYGSDCFRGWIESNAVKLVYENGRARFN